MNVGHVIVDLLLALGLLLELAGSLGVTVMRSVYDRLHYVCLTGFGAFLITIAILVQAGFSLIGDKALATGVILIVMSPVVVHTTARCLRARERGDWRHDLDPNPATRPQERPQ